MSPIGGSSDFSFSSALQYQGLNTETPQQLQTAGVISIPDGATSAAAATSGMSPSDTETADLVSSMSTDSSGLADPTELSGAYQLLNTNGTQTVQVIRASMASVGQQVDTQV